MNGAFVNYFVVVLLRVQVVSRVGLIIESVRTISPLHAIVVKIAASFLCDLFELYVIYCLVVGTNVAYSCLFQVGLLPHISFCFSSVGSCLCCCCCN